jgi:hypothetical protein
MAPSPRRKKKQSAFEMGREFKLRLPPDVSDRIEQKAKAEGRPQNRVIINELASFPELEQQRGLGELVIEIQTVLARHGARIAWHDLADDLLNAVDAVLAAKTGGELQAAVERLRVGRLAMLRSERTMQP